MSHPDPALTAALTATRTRIAAGWCQAHFAETADKTEAPVGCETAVRFSLWGAVSTSLLKAQRQDLFPTINWLLRRVLPKGHLDSEDWQDLPTTAQADVLALVDRAIGEVGE